MLQGGPVLNILWVVFLCSWKPENLSPPCAFPLVTLCFLLKSVRLFVFWKWALSYLVSIPCQMSTSEFWSLCPFLHFVWSCLLSSRWPDVAQCFPCSWLSRITLCICPLSSVSVHVDGHRLSSGKSPFLGFQWECSVLEEAPKACVSLSGCVLAWVVREFWIGFPCSVESRQEGFT